MVHNALVRGICFSPDGRRIISCSSDATCRVFDIAAGKQLHCLEAEEAFSCIAASDGYQSVVGSSDGTLSIWDLAADVAALDVLQVTPKAASPPTSVCVSADAQLLATGRESGDLQVMIRLSSSSSSRSFE